MEIKRINEYYIKDEKARKYNNIEEIKNISNLNNGDIIETIGYYEPNDGGGATYLIRNRVENDIEDNVFIYYINESLVAELIHSDEIIAEQLGFKSSESFDCGKHFMDLMSKNNTLSKPVTITFGNKNYYFTETLIRENLNFNIKGSTNNLGNYEKRTFFKPYEEGQRFIIKIGGTANFDIADNWNTYWKTNYNFENIIMSDENHPLIKTYNEYGLLCVEYFSGLKLGVSFSGTESRCMYFKNTWEIKFDDFSIRGCSAPVNDSCIYIDNCLTDGYSNTSAFFFNNVDLESINCSFIKTNSECSIQNWFINNISIENGTRSNKEIGKSRELIETKSTYESCQKIALLDFKSPVHGLTINQINLHNFGNRYFYIDGNNTKGVDSLINLDKNYNIVIGMINFNVCGGFQSITGSGSRTTYIKSIMTIDSLTFSPVTVPHSQVLAMNNDVFGYLYRNISGGLILINKTNFRYSDKSTILIKPGIYEDEKLFEIITPGYGRAYFGKYDGSSSKNVVTALEGGEVLTENLLVNFVPKITICINPKTTGNVGIYYRGVDGTWGGSKTVGIGESDLNKWVRKTITLDSSIVNNYPRIQVTCTSQFNAIDYIEVKEA